MRKFILSLILMHCSLLISYSQDVWTVQPSGTNSQLNYIYVYTYNLVWIAGNNGTILRTTNGGLNWIQLSSGTSNNLYAISPYTDSIYLAVGENGTVVLTTNFGTNWVTLNSGVNSTLRSIFCYSWMKALVVGDNSTIIRTTNRGTNWIQIQSPVSADLKSLKLYTVGTLATGSNGLIMKSLNQGGNWVTLPSGTNNNLNKLSSHYFTSTGWIAGNSGTLLKTNDGGYNWVSVYSGTSTDLLSITQFDSSYAWACGLNGKIIRTTNGGINWTNDLQGCINTINDIYFINPNLGWAVGSNGLILKGEIGLAGTHVLRLDANTINSWYSNWGNFNRNPITEGAGFEWPKNTGKTARYESGPWIGAKVGNDTLLALAEYSSEFFPGYTDNFGTPHGKDDPLYKVYKLTYGVNDAYRQQWPNSLLGNSDQGAPVYYDEQYHSWRPLDYADQTMFYSYTDSYPESHTVWSGKTSPLKADLKQINFAFDEPGALGNIQYSQFTLINRSTLPWINTYLGLWSDDDVGNASDDKIGCDTALGMGYTYNGQPVDLIYGNNPPAVSTVLIKGPAVYTANQNDTVFYCRGKYKTIKTGYRQIGMKVFNTYFGSDPIWGDPRIYYETYRIMVGLTRDGASIINPVTNQPTKFFFSGDPVANTGWVQTWAQDVRFLMSIGPFNMNPGDTQVIVIAQVIAQGTSNLNSISVLRQYAQIAKDYYNNCFYNVPIGIENTQNGMPTRFSLEQNYPNPFNPVTKIKFSIPLVKGVRGMNVKLIIYDILGREVATLIPPLRGGQEGLRTGNYEVEWDGSNFASGVYFYKLEAGNFSLTKKMVLIK